MPEPTRPGDQTVPLPPAEGPREAHEGVVPGGADVGSGRSAGAGPVGSDHAQAGAVGPPPAGPPPGGGGGYGGIPPYAGGPSGGGYQAGPPPKKPGIFRQATSTTGGTVALIVAACLVGLLLLGTAGVASLVAVRALTHEHRADRVEQMHDRMSGGLPPGQQRKMDRAPQQPGSRGNGNGQGNGIGGLLGGATALGNIQHGEFTMQGVATGKPNVMTVQRGTVTAASTTSLSVKSADGFTGKYVINGDTRGKAANAKVGDAVLVVAEKEGAKAVLVRSGRG
jgi:hypothetical protein